MAATVWYVPGWMRTQVPQEGVMPAMSNAFPKAEIAFKAWDGDKAVWPMAVESADKEAWRLAFEIATMLKEARENLTLVGHSLGGRIVARVLARLAEKDMRVHEAVLMAAAIPYDDPDLARMVGASALPIRAVCNPDDVTLRYVYAILGGERAPAFGANGTLKPIANVIECAMPSNITEMVTIDQTWAKSQTLKDIANHHALFYLDYLKSLREGAKPTGEVMVPQDFPTIKHSVVDGGVWWNVLAEYKGWKLEQHKLTTHCRILTPDRKCVAWGGKSEMAAAFEKVKFQVK